jgi:phosphoribosylamine--glycine ligase
MKILLVGSGAREHALAYKLSQHHSVICAPGNPGMGSDAEVVPIPANEHEALLKLAVDRAVELVVIGPEDPLIAGLGDRFHASGFHTFGPSAAAARLEGSKAFSKRLMKEANVPTAEFATFSDFSTACDYAKKSFDQGVSLAVKASGAALGRGVAVCGTLEEALDAIEAAMVDRSFGAAGEIVVLEERLEGREFSLFTLVGVQNMLSLPVAQDYKRALDRDRGPNTGGMGSYSPCQTVSEELVREVEARMVVPILDRLQQEGAPFTGLLFTGVMITESGPKCLEYNVRFGDPETQTIMMRLEGDFGAALSQVAAGQKIEPVAISDQSAVTVVVASSGYPGPYLKGEPVTVGQIPTGAKLFFAGVAEKDGVLINSGGRVVAASALGPNVVAARSLAYAAAKAVHFKGAYFRRDIASN